MRNTLRPGNCDLWMDMASDTEGAEMTTPLYRSTFVLVYREDSGIIIKNFDDPALQRGRIGVYQVSAIRQALAAHGIMQNTVIQYLSHDGDIVPEDQPSYSGAAGRRQEDRDGRRVGPDGGLVQGDQESAAGDPAGQSDGRHRAARIRHGDGDAARTSRSQGRRRESDARQQGQDPRDPRRVRRAAGQVRRLHHRRRPAFARTVQADRAPAQTAAANAEPQTNRRGSQEMARARRRSRTPSSATRSSRTTSSA